MQWRVAGKEFAAAMEWVKIFINFTFTAGLAGETFASAAVSLPCVPVNQKIQLMWVRTHDYNRCCRVNCSQKRKFEAYPSID